MPKSSKLSPAEREVLIAKTAEDSEWCVYCTDPSALPHYLALSERVGGRVVKHQGGTKIFLPADSVGLQVRRKLNLSATQRAKRVEQMKAGRAGHRPSATTPA
jgi:hypothetical protein